LARFVFGSLRQPQITGNPGMVGKQAIAIKAFTEAGQVTCDGCTYTAISTSPIKARQKVRVKSVDGIKLLVEPIDSD